MNCIVAVAENWAIGDGSGMLFHLPDDLKYFRKMTTGKTMVMGRRTLDSFPGGRPLPKRPNYVLTRDPSFERDGALICHSYEELKEQLKSVPDDDIYVIGGGEIYKALLPFCSKAYVTHIKSSAPASVYFPDLTKIPGWKLTSESEPLENNGISFTFCVYENVSPKVF